MQKINLPRRDFLKFSFFAGINLLSACGQSELRPVLRSAPDLLPIELVRNIPPPWEYKPLNDSFENNLFDNILNKKCDLLAIGDGWLSSISPKKLSLLSYPGLIEDLNFLAKEFLENLPKDFSQRVLPFSFSPWVMLFRNGDKWLTHANESWSVLLNDDLKGNVVLPNSPRLIMSIAEKITVQDSLKKLRAQVLTYDDKNALNWLLNGDARVAVLPLQNCLKRVKFDQRFSVAFPKLGSPLNWTLLLSPKPSKEPLPIFWINELWSSPILGKLLADGLIPPLKLIEIEKEITKIPISYRNAVFPNKEIWSQCWSLPPLDEFSSNEMIERWKSSSP